MSEIPLDLRYEPVMPADLTPGIGCIGAGFIMADCHLVAYRNAGFNPVAIANRTRSKAEEVAKRHGIEKVYEDYEELLADPAVEVVDIALPPDLQRGVVDRICEGYAGKIRGILAQKPLAMTYEDARHIVETCAAAGITLAVNQNMRYDQSI
ncbi:MAG: Gfo/Idh/MocA family oxidoreductase, partial [Planctomycetota bacterium]|nr:Gfo/Idh/MocA family oxidoreductase [Planctomycetota bacterium]